MECAMAQKQRLKTAPGRACVSRDPDLMSGDLTSFGSQEFLQRAMASDETATPSPN